MNKLGPQPAFVPVNKATQSFGTFPSLVEIGKMILNGNHEAEGGPAFEKGRLIKLFREGVQEAGFTEEMRKALPKMYEDDDGDVLTSEI